MRYPILTDVEISNNARVYLQLVREVETAFLVANGWFLRLFENAEGEYRAAWNHETLAPIAGDSINGLSFDSAVRVARSAEGEQPQKPAPNPVPKTPSAAVPSTSDLQAAFNTAIRGLTQIAKTQFGSQPLLIANNTLREVERILGRPLTNPPDIMGPGYGQNL